MEYKLVKESIMELERQKVMLYSGMSNKIERNCWIVGNIAIYGSDRRYQLYHLHTGLAITQNYAINKRDAALAAMELQLLPLAWESHDESTIAIPVKDIPYYLELFRKIMRDNRMLES
jgi:hypothetical protein